MYSNDIDSGFADLTEIFLTKLDKPPKQPSPKKQSPKKISKNNLLEAISQSSESDDDSSDDQFSYRFKLVFLLSTGPVTPNCVRTFLNLKK